MDKIAVILDTDIGSNVDDAIALSYLLRQPRCELVGVTTVSGEATRRASLVDAVCTEYGWASAPIHVGRTQPLVSSQLQPEAPHFELLQGRDYRQFSPNNTAVAFLRKQIRQRPGEITILAIGPLTNIAQLLAEDPDIAAMIVRIVAMGGRYFHQDDDDKPEWNMRCDPDAAALVLAASIDITLIGMDVTTLCTLTRDECLTKFRALGRSMELVTRMTEFWFQGKETIRFHDPLAASFLFKADICGTTHAFVKIGVGEGDVRGRTTISLDGERQHSIAHAVNTEAFFQHFFGILNRPVTL
jgi:purine nucleosidase